MNWIVNNTYIFGKYGKTRKFTKKTMVASFDLDHTIIKPSGGKRFSDSDDDWEFFDNTVIDKLNRYYLDGYNIVIVSNQGGIPKGKTILGVWKNKIENMAEGLKIPFIILASMHNDLYRKPRTALWDKFIKCNPKHSFYCGDAGGLPKRKIKRTVIKKDFSDSDLKFACNLGIPFMHRDEFIYNKKQTLAVKYSVDLKNISTDTYSDFTPLDETEMIINVGYAGSGKSYYTKKYILPHHYVHINRDTLKTMSKCKRACEKALKDGNSVIIDNTNPSRKARKVYIDIAKKYNISVRCLWFNTLKELAMHNNIYRHIINGGENKIVPKIAYNIYKKYFEKPVIEEGFYQVDIMKFKLNLNDVDKKIYYSYLV